MIFMLYFVDLVGICSVSSKDLLENVSEYFCTKKICWKKESTQFFIVFASPHISIQL